MSSNLVSSYMSKHSTQCLTALLLALGWLCAQEPGEKAAAQIDPKDDGVRVSVLGYHDFTLEGEETEMCIRADKFRKQMELLRDYGISVISLEEFHAWKLGKKAIPEKSILITVDDGWKTFHQLAKPILDELGYPYTMFLYKNYVDGGGRALTSTMIRRMIKDGATIGSHSVSHPYPVVFKQQQRKGDLSYLEFLRKEMGESKTFLEKRFKTPITAYSYPGGYVSKEMLPLVEELGYDYAFTTKPGKTMRSTPESLIPRFMILGNYDRIFEFATDFGELSPATTTGILEKPDYPVSPEPGSVIPSRLPVIRADLSKVKDLDAKSLEMRVSGFTKVPATLDPDTRIYTWKVNRPLRTPSCSVTITWRDLQGDTPEKPLRWSFLIDREAAYLSPTVEP